MSGYKRSASKKQKKKPKITVKKMKKKNFPIVETIVIAIGEIIASAITCLIFFIAGGWEIHYSVFTGSALGIVIMMANFFVLAISTNIAIDRAMAERGNKEFTDEEAEEFAAKHKAKIALISRISFFLRAGSMIVALVLALVLRDRNDMRVFDVIATLVPLVAFYPIVFVSQMLIQRRGKNGKSG